MKAVEINPSVTTADFARLGDECVALHEAGIDRFHWDVMDGHYVPNITFGPDVIASCRPLVGNEFEAHVMCEHPEALLPRYAEAGCGLVLLHPETMRQPARAYQQVRELGMKAGVALSPATPLHHVEDVLDLIDQLLVMTVNPGFGGQSYIAAMEAKIARASAMVAASGRDIRVEVDGGIARASIEGAAAAGADTFVVGSALWRYPDFASGVSELRSLAEGARPSPSTSTKNART